MVLPYYFYRRNPTGQEFLFLIGVKLLTPKIILDALRATIKSPGMLIPEIVLEALRVSVKCTPNLQLLSLPSIKPSQLAPAAAAA